jgi:hypothetical protein
MTARRIRGAGLLWAALVAVAVSAPARADTVTDWNVHATEALITNERQGPTVSTIHLAIVHGAVYDAVNSIDGRHEPYLVKIRARRFYSQDAAAATAAYRVLAGLLPGQQAGLAQKYQDSLSAIPPGHARDGGIAVGEIAAAAMLAARANDGRFPATPFRFPAPATLTEPWPAGQWRPVGSATANDPAAWVKDVTPFLVDDPDRYRSAGPNPLTSRRYAREFEEVKRIGSLTSESRSADQTDAARFWMEGPLIWTRLSRQLSAGFSPADAARLYAGLYLPASDAVISCWRDKARWLFWRPVTAIREADGDGNPATEADRDWVALINNPPYPDHPSGLSCVSSAMAGSLAGFFGTDRIPFEVGSMTSNTTRKFRGFSAAVDEVVDARVWSGIHFRTADEDGARIGAQVSRYWDRNAFGRDD